MKQLEKKIEILNNFLEFITDHQIRNEYEWSNYGTCNAGLLLRSINNSIGARDFVTQMHRQFPEFSGVYSQITEDVGKPWCWSIVLCETSGLPMIELFEGLIKAGFTLTEIEQLEELSSQPVIDRIGRGPLRRSKYINLKEYTEVWIEILNEQLMEQRTKQLRFLYI